MADQLTAGQASGAQTTTQSPQTSAAGANTAKASSVQPGTSLSLLNGQSGVALHPTALSTVNLGRTTQTQSQTAQLPPAAPAHHIKAISLAIPVLLFLVAMVMFWSTKRSVKSTTDYS